MHRDIMERRETTLLHVSIILFFQFEGVSCLFQFFMLLSIQQQKKPVHFRSLLIQIMTKLNSYKYFIIFYTIMHQSSWNQIENLSEVTPPQRWGQASCTIENSFVIFGGFEENKYFNDLWVFDSSTLQWIQITTVGQIPVERSHSTLNLHTNGADLVLFGGGTKNKERFNTIHILHWRTRQWKLLSIPEGQKAPESRTYHSAEIIGKYLVIFGGQAIDDLGDLWLFDLEKHMWTEITYQDEDLKPEARRFHASCKKSNQVIIIGGCKGKYKIISDIYTLNFDKFLNTQNPEDLVWKPVEISQKNRAIQKWGHTATYNQLNNKLYIFGGRLSSGDSNQLIQVDLRLSQATPISLETFQRPQPRRRHSANFLGNSLVVFGGYNNSYFNDLYSIQISSSFSFDSNYQKNSQQVKKIKLKYGQEYSPFKENINSFKNKQNSSEILILPDEQFERYMSDNIFIQKQDKFNPELFQDESIVNDKICDAMVEIEVEGFSRLFVDKKSLEKSDYFKMCMIYDSKIHFDQVKISKEYNIFKIFVASLLQGFPVIPQGFCLRNWSKMLLFCDYFCEKELPVLIEKYLIQEASLLLIDQMIEMAEHYKLIKLSQRCAELMICNHFDRFYKEQEQLGAFTSTKPGQMIDKFQLVQTQMLEGLSNNTIYSKNFTEIFISYWLSIRFGMLLRFRKKLKQNEKKISLFARKKKKNMQFLGLGGEIDQE